MNKITKRVFSFLLVAAMVFSILPSALPSVKAAEAAQTPDDKTITIEDTEVAVMNKTAERTDADEWTVKKDDLLYNMITWPDNMDPAKWYYLDVQEATNSHGYVRKENYHEKWTVLEEPRGWAALEK